MDKDGQITFEDRLAIMYEGIVDLRAFLTDANPDVELQSDDGKGSVVALGTRGRIEMFFEPYNEFYGRFLPKDSDEDVSLIDYAGTLGIHTDFMFSGKEDRPIVFKQLSQLVASLNA